MAAETTAFDEEEEASAIDFDDDDFIWDDCIAWEWDEYSSWDAMLDDDWTVADSILEVISATSAEWADASMVEIDFSWCEAEALLVAEDDLALETSCEVEVMEVFLPSLEEALIEETAVSSWAATLILSLDMVLLLTRGDFWANSWLAFNRLEEAAMADSCLVSDE